VRPGLLFAPLRFLLRVLLRPFALWSRRRLLASAEWVELDLEGAVLELPPPQRLPPFLRRWLGREDGRRVVLAGVRELSKTLAADPRPKGLLVRLGPLSAGWASSAELRALLDAVRDAQKAVLVFIKEQAGNHEFLVAGAGTRVVAPPSALIAPVGASSGRVFLREALDRIGVQIELSARGRYKSAGEAYTRNDRSEADREQTQALLNAIDEALLGSIAGSRKVSADKARAMVDAAPVVGERAVTAGFVDALRREEDLDDEQAEVVKPEGPKGRPRTVRAGAYLEAKKLPPLFRSRARHVGVVEVHGAIVDRGGRVLGATERVAVSGAVVADLRAALRDPRIAAVVLHVNSRGGSVSASDAIYAAVKRLNAEKPVIACYGDVAASGGYYVACGARAIIASPLTVTGSIGVFTALPTWPVLGSRLLLHRDVLKNRLHADFHDPWRPPAPDERQNVDESVAVMYDDFIALVAAARGMSKEAVHAVAEGRVWIGRDAEKQGLVDGLGGMAEAIERAKAAANGRFREELLLVRARFPMPRPEAPPPAGARLLSELGGAIALLGGGPVAGELAALVALCPRALAWAYAPIDVL
jgi:protease-4